VFFNAKLAEMEKEGQEMTIPDKLELNIEGFHSENKRSAFYTTEELEKERKVEEVVHNKKLDKIEEIYQQLKQKNREEDEEDEDEEIEWIRAGITVRIKPH
jgi:tRNA nucleotidyltransferase/poly(A) polymerase